MILGEEIAKDAFLQDFMGDNPNRQIVHKYGKGTVGAAWTFISASTAYQTPTVATSLELVSSLAGDGPAGAGLRSIYFEGLDINGAFQSEIVLTNGLTPVAFANQYLRLFRAYGVTSGTYATVGTSSQVGNITIRVAGVGATWMIIPVDTGIGFGNSLTSGYTVPVGYDWAVYINSISVDSTKSIDLAFFQRENILDFTAPYEGVMRVSDSITGVTGTVAGNLQIPIAKGTGPCDLGFFGKITASTGNVSVDYYIVLTPQ